MAGDWIKMRCNLGSDPAVITLATVLDLDQDDIVGKLHKLWSWADQHTVDGRANVARMSRDSGMELWIDRYIGVAGFANALADVGWLELHKAGFTIPNFGRHNGQSAKNRAENTKRQKQNRSRNERDKAVTKARPEKRREEKSIKPSISSFEKPTTEQVAAYCQERSNGIDAEAFVSFYQSKGWMIGKNKMKDWKAAVHTWEKKKAADTPEKKSRIPDDQDLANWNPIDGGLG